MAFKKQTNNEDGSITVKIYEDETMTVELSSAEVTSDDLNKTVINLEEQ